MTSPDDLRRHITDSFEQGISLRRLVGATETERILRIGIRIVTCLQAGNKVLFCGNGGSAADAQHLSAEFVGRFISNRKSLPALALSTDTSLMTAVANDFGFDQIFSRQIESLGAPGDVFVGISTSGNSANVLRAAEVARSKGIYVVGLTGQGGGKLGAFADEILAVPSKSTARIQEVHITVGHILCEIVESHFAENV